MAGVFSGSGNRIHLDVEDDRRRILNKEDAMADITVKDLHELLQNTKALLNTLADALNEFDRSITLKDDVVIGEASKWGNVTYGGCIKKE